MIRFRLSRATFFASITCKKILIGKKILFEDFEPFLTPYLREQPLFLDTGRKVLKFQTSVQKFLTVFELFRRVHLRGRPRNSLMGSFIEKIKIVFYLEHHSKQLLLCNAYQNISGSQAIRVEKLTLSGP